MQFIYLVRPREYAQKNENVYKIGRTGDILYNRLNGYSKSTEILLALAVNDCIKLETELKRLFTTLYIKRKDIGDEYFQGSLSLMIRTITTVICPEYLYQELNTDDKINCLEPGKNVIGSCEFDKHCDTCEKHIGKNNTYDYCLYVCDRCISFRKLKKKDNDTLLLKYYNEHISEEPKQLEKSHKSTNIVIHINNIGSNKNYIYTKDLFFYVTITSEESNANEKLRYIFTYLMCGWSGNKLFPEQPLHSKALTFPVIAAKYDIVIKNGIYKLHGILRYQYKNNVKMTVKKLENMGDDKFIVKASLASLYDNKKTQVSRNDIDNFIKTLENTDNGSNIDDFYAADVH